VHTTTKTKKIGFEAIGLAETMAAGLPDCFWYNIPKQDNIPNDHKIHTPDGN
jgi:hypothetical protein